MFFFFFSSKRRHTRCSRDWSSDVFSSDLIRTVGSARPIGAHSGVYNPIGLLVKSRYFSSYAQHPPKRSLNSTRSEEHTSELQSRLHLVCRLLLEKKKKKQKKTKDNKHTRH